MRNVRFHPLFPQAPGAGGDAAQGMSACGMGATGGANGGAGGGGRLNLLLSHGGWEQDSWVDRLPRLLEPMGVVSHRAENGKHAATVIESMPIHIAIVDLALPLDRPEDVEFAEGGVRLLELLARLSQPPPTVVVRRSRTHRDDTRELNAALRAGAYAVVDRPADTHELNLMLEVLRRCLTRFYAGRWPSGV